MKALHPKRGGGVYIGASACGLSFLGRSMHRCPHNSPLVIRAAQAVLEPPRRGAFGAADYTGI